MQAGPRFPGRSGFFFGPTWEMPILLRLIFTVPARIRVVLDTLFWHMSNEVGAGKKLVGTDGGGSMTQKWTFFTIGVMAGMIALLSFALLLQASESTAYAAPPARNGTSDPSAGIVVATGGSQSQIQDICWVLYKRKNSAQASGGEGETVQDSVTAKEELLTLGCYQVVRNGKSMKLVGLRNVSYDMDLLEYQNERPSVADIVKALRTQQKKKKK
jgi:hypothetical protein